VTLVAGAAATHETTALFARALRNSERVIVPLNDSALRSDESLPALYCVHSVSGVAGTDFLELARHLETAARFYGIQAPPKMRDPQFGSSVEDVADHYVAAVLKAQPTGPIILAGYCVGAVIALAMAKQMRAAGRTVGPLLAIDGAPENVGAALTRWRLKYWLELLRNVPGWLSHGDLIRTRNMRSLIWSISSNAYAISRGAIGLRRGEKLDGGFAIDGVMDVTNYTHEHKLFINRLFSALFKYVPEPYPGQVVLFEAKTTPLLYLPQLGRAWLKIAPQSRIVAVVGTHIGMMHEPYVAALAEQMRASIQGPLAPHDAPSP
jgi:thioesterase domain-containing protein